MIEVRQCDAGHLSLDAANWECPWCEVERLRTEMHDCSDRDTRAFASLQAQAHRQHERGEKAEKQTEIWRSAHDGLRQDRDEWRSASQMHEAEVERLRKWEDAGQQFLAERDLLRKEVERLSRDRGMLKEEVGRLRGLADEIEADARLLAPGETFHGGPLHGASVFNVMLWAVRRLRGGGE